MHSSASALTSGAGDAVRSENMLQEVLQQDADVLAALAQRRHLDVHDVEAVVEVFAERLVGDVIDAGAGASR